MSKSSEVVSTCCALVFLLVAVVGFEPFVADATVVIQSLGGNDWITYNTNKSIRVASRVPGSIYTDLYENGVLKDGYVYDNFNDVNYRWVSYDNWTFEKTFNVEDEVLKQDHIYLTAHGLDTIGNVTLNGHSLGSVSNMFVRYKWPVKELLKQKDNKIQVSFESAPLYGKKRYDESVAQNYPIPPACPSASQNGECHVNYLRKMQASFSWDWGPAVPTQGIWRPIELEAFQTLFLRTVSVATIAKENNQWTLNVTAWLENSPSAKITGDLSLTLDGNNVLLSKKNFTVTCNTEGEAFVNVLVDVPAELKVRSWYPNGVGEPVLYPLKIQLSTSQESVSKQLKIGFRTIELSQEELSAPKAGDNIINAFYFKVNNKAIWTKGSNWIPAHVLYEKITDEYLYELLLSAKLANMNMIRVWGGGFYETDRFYEIADELGLLVYQDMMFASSLYPADDAFFASVTTEIRQQIRRLHYHPSIAIWSGNNENDGNIAGPYWQEIKDHWDRYKKDYVKLTINVTMETILHEDNSRPFVSSCPSNGVADKRKGYISKQDKRAGDMHVYIGGNGWDWKNYPSAKFVSEYGFQSLSSLSLLERYINSEYLSFSLNKALVHRQHQNKDSQDSQLREQFHFPANGGIDRLNDYIYLTQVNQAMSMKTETEFYRRNRKLDDNGDGFTMGALYWQLNEVWPSFSWSSLEFGNKWKILHYYVRNFFDNYLVNIYEDGDKLKVVIIRDDYLDEDIKFQVTIKLFDWSSIDPVYTFVESQLSTSPFNVTLVNEQKTSDFLNQNGGKCKDRNRCFITVTALGKVGNQTIERKNFLFLGRAKDVSGLVKPNIQVTSIVGPQYDNVFGVHRFNISLKTDYIAPFVWLDFKPEANVQGIFSDNGFILNENIEVTFETHDHTISSTALRNFITIKSLKDVVV